MPGGGGWRCEPLTIAGNFPLPSRLPHPHAGNAATCLARIGYDEAARIAARQTRLIGALQHPMVTGDDDEAGSRLHALAPTYRTLLTALEEHLSSG